MGFYMKKSRLIAALLSLFAVINIAACSGTDSGTSAITSATPEGWYRKTVAFPEDDAGDIPQFTLCYYSPKSIEARPVSDMIFPSSSSTYISFRESKLPLKKPNTGKIMSLTGRASILFGE